MPILLKFLTAHALACFAFLVVSVIPSNAFAINGRHVSYAVWWSSGAGAFASLLGLAGLGVGVLLLSKWRHARIAYLGFLALAMVVPYPVVGHPGLALVGLAVVGAVALYLYRKRTTQCYFAP
jgi:hypothetical protein